MPQLMHAFQPRILLEILFCSVGASDVMRFHRCVRFVGSTKKKHKKPHMHEAGITCCDDALLDSASASLCLRADSLCLSIFSS